MEPRAYLEITRPHNCLMGGLTVLSSVQVAKVFYGLFFLNRLWPKFWVFPSRFWEVGVLAYFVYVLIAAAGNVVNDIYDVEVDRINKPNRPLPRGAMSVREAKVLAGVLWSAGCVLAFLISIPSGVLAVIFSTVGLLYAAKVKVLGLLGNFVVSFSFAFGYIYGSLVVSSDYGFFSLPLMVVLFFFTAFCVLQGREIIKVMEDVEGDVLRDAKTIARVYGLRVASYAGAAFNVAGIACFTLCPVIDSMGSWWLRALGFWFYPFYFPGVAAVGASTVLILAKYMSRKAQSRASFLDKVGAFFGILAFLTGPYSSGW
ncbi:MAG: geranylgeranylglycerol-phosphate geranylgeranyltransferase [Candidatus Freyarchaeota archaeon]|nr:geranylgeranylglycerol-phosphate geranylgeranyltransferase [Candidatus Jordarchaeia archaeon]